VTDLITFSETDNPVIDVVFIHGLAGDPIHSWKSSGGVWPEWVASDNPRARVLSVRYPFGKSFFNLNRRQLSIHDHALGILELLKVSDFGSRRIVIVAHSLGGIVAKEILKVSAQSSDIRTRKISRRCAGLVLLATPSSLSGFNKVFGAFNYLPFFRSPLASESTGELDAIHSWYRDFAAKNRVTTLAFASATDRIDPHFDSSVPDAVVVPLDVSHVEISKPNSKNSLVVISVQDLITRVLRLASKSHGRLR